MKSKEELFKIFKEKAIIKFGEKFNYEKVNYIKASEDVVIICPIHGEFINSPTQFLSSKHGCQKCARDNQNIKSKLTTEDFVKRSSIVHSNFYNYEKTEYINSDNKVIITCPIHGDFEQRPADHLRNHGCPKCKGDKITSFNKNTKKDTLENFINKSNLTHNFKYDYSKVIYVNSRIKVCIICPEHDEFLQTPSHHISGTGCPLCKPEIDTLNTEIFIQRSNLIHNQLYNYSKVNYLKLDKKVCIICEKHGEFWQTPSNHIWNKQGCPICNYSKGELLIHNWLKENNIPFKPQFELITDEIARNSNLMIIDFFVKYKEQQYFIEYDGIQHFEYIPHFHKGGVIDFEKQIRRDKVLNEFCELHKDKITLIRFKYDESNEEIINKLNKIINEK